MSKQGREVEFFEPSEEWEMFKKDYVSKGELSEIFNVSKAWIDKTFSDENEKIKVYITRIKEDENGEKEEYRNKYIYISKRYIERVLQLAKWYKFTGKNEDYEALKTAGALSYFWERIDCERDIRLENIHPGYRMPKGGVREKTAIRNGYLRVSMGHITLYYDAKK